MGVFPQVITGVVFALADAILAVGIPGAGLLDDVVGNSEFDDLAFARNAFSVENVEFSLTERRRDLVLDDLGAGLGTDDLFALLDRADAADVDTHRGVELQRIAAGRGFGVAEHHADLHADLVDENHQRVRTLDVRRQLAQRLRHQPCLQAHLRLAHLAFDFSTGHQCGHRIDDHHIDRTRTHQHVGDFQRLLAVVRLRNDQLVDFHAQLAGVLRVECVFRINERRRSAEFLHLRDHRQRQRGFARRFRTVDFNHTAARQAADAEADVEAQRTGRHRLDVLGDIRLAHAHDRALAELFFDLRQRCCKRFGFVFVHGVLVVQSFVQLSSFSKNSGEIWRFFGIASCVACC